MKILFLDFDGVLNSELFYHSRLKNRLNRYLPLFKIFNSIGLAKFYGWLFDFDTREKWLLSMIDAKAVSLLNQICENTSCKIVISSTWRKTHGGWEECYNLLKKKGFTGEVISQTPVLGGFRGEEIERWIVENPNVESYVILDDDSDFFDYQKLKHFVWVDRYCGLTSTSVYKCSYILNRNL